MAGAVLAAAAALFLLMLTGVPVPAAGTVFPDPAANGRPPSAEGTTFARSVLDLQPGRTVETATAPGGVRLTLVNLNPNANAWFILTIQRPRSAPESYHLENLAPATRRIRLASDGTPRLVIQDGPGRVTCRPWSSSASELPPDAGKPLPFRSICHDMLTLRTSVPGNRTDLEWTADLLRENLWFGEGLVNLAKSALYRDRYLEVSEIRPQADPGQAARAPGRAELREHPVLSTRLAFDLISASPAAMEAGSWYRLDGFEGIYASVMQPGLISPDILHGDDLALPLDPVERDADVFLVGFDLSLFQLAYETGTDHPRLDWSSRPSGAARTEGLPGPDGIADPAPVAPVGMVHPALAGQVAAAFTGGFKREHGAFKYGKLANYSHGHHYGFVIQGTVLSRLQPGLSTLYALADGTIGMKAWTREDDVLLPKIRFARQNGVPLLDAAGTGGRGVPGDLVRDWLKGNWSGSVNAEQRTLRSGACLKEASGAQFLIYAWFSTATPSGMARTFQSYGCSHAMLLDMNAIEHTYMAVYAPSGQGMPLAHHLIPEMRRVDLRDGNGGRLPRFLAYPDNRDFFYLLRKERMP